MADQQWTVLVYLCGDTAKMAHGIKADVEELLRAALAPSMGLAIQADVHNEGARRYLRAPGQDLETEEVGAVDSGSGETLRDFLIWSLRELPAENVALVIGGTGILDPNSAVGAPANNWTDVFAICDDEPARNALEIDELRHTLEGVLDDVGLDRFRMVAFDMCRMQFLEVAYELETVAEFVIAPQTIVPADGWNYEDLLRAWGEAVQAEKNPSIEEIAKIVVNGAEQAYVAHASYDIVVSAIDLRRLDDLARDFDAFTLAYMQALGDKIAWHARGAVANAIAREESAYDLRELLNQLKHELKQGIAQPLSAWLAELLNKQDRRRRAEYVGALERGLTRLRPPLSQGASTVHECIKGLRTLKKDSEKRHEGRLPVVTLPFGSVQDETWQALFAEGADLPVRLREEYVVLQQEREHARYLLKLADRILRHLPEQDDPSGLLVARAARLADVDGRVPCGVALYRPTDLDHLVDSNYLKLEFTRRVHWAALLGATNLIANDHRALWRVISSMLGSADPRGREDLISRLVGATSVAASYRGQFRALAPSPLVTLSLEPLLDSDSPAGGLTDRYRLRLESARRDATLKQNDTRVNPNTIQSSLDGLERLLRQGWIDSEDLDRVESLGRTLGEDIVQDLEDSLASETAIAGDREVHMQLQIPVQLMKYPWELMHDGQAWLSERYALGRQVFMEQSAVRWSSRRRSGGLRVLIVGDPLLQSPGRHQQLPGARDEAEHVASLFERLQEQIGVGMDFDRRRDAHIHRTFTRQDFRHALRTGVYDIIHFAGHAVFDDKDPLRSGWVLSDGTMWAQEIRNTLVRTTPPWLVYANACEAAMEGTGPEAKYQRDVYGLASAFINKGVGAYIAPLWPIDDGMAMKIASDFYALMGLDRMTVGEALCHAKRRAKAAVLGTGRAQDSLVTLPAYMGLSWASLVLYGDPTQTLVQLMAARNEPSVAVPTSALMSLSNPMTRRRRTPLHGEAPLQAAPNALIKVVTGPGMRTLDRTRGAETLGHDDNDLAVIERGGIRYWATITSGQPTPIAADGLAAVAEQAQQKQARDRGFTDYLKVVARWATGRLDDSLVTELARQYDHDIVPEERLLVLDPFTGALRPRVSSDATTSLVNPQAKGCLLLIHGTFSTSEAPVTGLGSSFFEWAHRHYRQVLAFDHWTLSKSPSENARLLWQQLPEWARDAPKRIDIITHSRGGLVARALVQLKQGGAAPCGEIAEKVGHVVFVGTPNYGTSLANPKNWGCAADLLVNLVHVDALGVFGKLSGFLARLAASGVGAEILRRIPGLQAQNPLARVPGEFLGDLLANDVPSCIRVSAVSTNYAPRRDEAHLKFLAKVAGDAVADRFFQGFNDLVVDTRNVYYDNVEGARRDRLVKPENRLIITPPDSGLTDAGELVNLYGVHHTNLFDLEKTREFIIKQLLL